MGDWVIREALRQMQICRREGVDLQVSINTFAASYVSQTLGKLATDTLDIPMSLPAGYE